MRIGIDNYGLHPLGLSPLETIQWAIDHKADGVAFSGLNENDQKLITPDYLRDIRQFASEYDLYIEWGGAQHIPLDMGSWAAKDIFEVNRKAASEAEALGTGIVRSCSGGLMRWKPDSPATDIFLQEMAGALKAQRQMLIDCNVILAIETHFEFTTHELRRLFEMCEAEPGEYLGICLDTMNLMTMLEDPISATERILPFVVSTHIKDGGILLNDDGMVSFPTEIGNGVIDIIKIINQLETLPWDIDLSVEDHGGDFPLPIFDPAFLSEFPDLTTHEMTEILLLTRQTQRKQEAGECIVVDREEWADHCEIRIAQDITALKKLMDNR